MLFTTCECYLKKYIRAFEKEPGFVNANNTFFIEKLVVCTNIVLRKIKYKTMDDVLKEAKKYKDVAVHGLSISKDEQGAITHLTYPESYTKFLLKEDWYIKMYNQVSVNFKKDKTIKNKAEKQ